MNSSTLDLLGPANLVDMGIADSISTLSWWRQKGTGPKWAKIGKHIRYNYEDVVAWYYDQVETSNSRNAVEPQFTPLNGRSVNA